MSGDVTLSAKASNAVTMGFASLTGSGQAPPTLRRIGLATAPDGDTFTAEWFTLAQRTAGGGAGVGEVLVVGVVCTAAEVPTDLVADQAVVLANPGGVAPSAKLPSRSYQSLRAEDPQLAIHIVVRCLSVAGKVAALSNGRDCSSVAQVGVRLFAQLRGSLQLPPTGGRSRPAC